MLQTSGDVSKTRVVAFIKKEWFLIGVLLVICCAKLMPDIGRKGGPLHPEWTVKYAAVMVIFFSSGITLQAAQLREALGNAKLHFLVQSFSMLLVPLLVGVIVFILSHALSTITQVPISTLQLGEDGSWASDMYYALLGLKIVSCLPPPVSSAFILTQAAGGNTAGAMFNATLGSLMGLVITPVLMAMLIIPNLPDSSAIEDKEASLDVRAIVDSLVITVVGPLVTGQLVRVGLLMFAPDEGYDASKDAQALHCAGNWHSPTTVAHFVIHEIPYKQASKVVLLLIIYSVFCETFSQDLNVSIMIISIVILCVIVLQITLLYLMKMIVSQASLSMPREDGVAAMFTGTQKSLTLGMPLLQLLLGTEPRIILLMMPLLVYHPSQILLGTLLIPRLKLWMTKDPLLEDDIELDNIKEEQRTAEQEALLAELQQELSALE